MTRVVRLTALGLVLLGSPGCLGLTVGGGAEIQSAVTPPTLGQEFLDLQRAHTAGALSDEEYEAVKRKLILEGRSFF